MTGTRKGTLDAMLEHSTARDPAKPCFINKQTRTTYEQLTDRALRLAGGMRTLGLVRGDRVALCHDSTIEYLVAYYGVLLAGGAVVPLCPDTRTPTLVYALSHCGARAVILDRRNTKLLASQKPALPQLDAVISIGGASLLEPGEFPQQRDVEDLINSGAPSLRRDSTEDDLASIVYTSGTTGRPKGVMLSHRNLLANVRSIVSYLELSPVDNIAMVLPFFYVYGNSVLHTHICAGGTISQLGSMAFPAAVLSGLTEHRCTGFSGVPSTFARLIQFSALEQHDLSSLRYVTQAGGPMTPALTEKLKRVVPHVKIFVMYGQTEASARLSYLPPEKLEQKIGSAGIAIPGVTLCILDPQGNEVPRGEVGEIVATGDNIMRGYWRSPEETARVLTPHGMRTGDLARMDEDGYIYIVARKSDMIKSGAHRIGPQEIEDVIEKLDGVAQCAVVGVPDELLGEAIAAFVIPREPGAVTEREIRRICHEHLPKFKQPAHVRLVADLPRTQTGKLRRSELKEWFAAGE